MKPVLILGTRGSDLALAQARAVRDQLALAHPQLRVDVKIIRTTGDKRLDVDLANPGPLGKGLFTKQLEEALLKGSIDAAVHSLKDLPVGLPDGLVLGAIPPRADPSDAVVSKWPGGLDGLPRGAKVATSSVRRAALLRHFRPDLVTVAMRGNVPTRLRKLADDPAIDAIVLAKAGLDRLGPVVPDGLHVAVEPRLLPAPGQGALGIECRAEDTNTLGWLAALHCPDTARCVHAERALLAIGGGGCAAPLGALAEIRDGALHIRAISFEPGGPVHI